MAGVVTPCAFVVFLVMGRDYIDSYDLIFYIFLFGLLLTALYAWQRRVPERMNDVFRYLGKLSYPLFLFHYGMLILLKTYAPNMRYRYGVTMFMLMTLLAAAVVLFLQKVIRQRLNF